MRLRRARRGRGYNDDVVRMYKMVYRYKRGLVSAKADFTTQSGLYTIVITPK